MVLAKPDMTYRPNETPLYTAARTRRADAVERLLSSGATVPLAPSVEAASRSVDPLGVAVFNNDERIVQLLLDRGVEAIGGPYVFHWAIGGAIQTNRPRLLDKLLAVEGEGRKGYWAGALYNGAVPMLHFAAAFGSVGAVSVLLAAGASEGQRDALGTCAGECIGRRVPAERASPSSNAGLRRMLERGPAYRALSRAWPSAAAVPAAAAAATAAAAAGDGRKGNGAPLGVRVWRSTDPNLVVSRLGR